MDATAPGAARRRWMRWAGAPTAIAPACRAWRAARRSTSPAACSSWAAGRCALTGPASASPWTCARPGRSAGGAAARSGRPAPARCACAATTSACWRAWSFSSRGRAAVRGSTWPPKWTRPPCRRRRSSGWWARCRRPPSTGWTTRCRRARWNWAAPRWVANWPTGRSAKARVASMRVRAWCRRRWRSTATGRWPRRWTWTWPSTGRAWRSMAPAPSWAIASAASWAASPISATRGCCWTSTPPAAASRCRR